MKKLLPIIISVVAAVFGVVFVIVGITTIATKDLYDTKVTATVVEVTEELVVATAEDEADHIEKTAFIDYEVNGQKFEHVVSPVQNDSLKTGDTVGILCQSKDPSKISGPNPAAAGVIFIVLGAIVAICGCFTAVRKFIGR